MFLGKGLHGQEQLGESGAKAFGEGLFLFYGEVLFCFLTGTLNSNCALTRSDSNTEMPNSDGKKDA